MIQRVANVKIVAKMMQNKQKDKEMTESSPYLFILFVKNTVSSSI